MSVNYKTRVEVTDGSVSFDTTELIIVAKKFFKYQGLFDKKLRILNYRLPSQVCLCPRQWK